VMKGSCGSALVLSRSSLRLRMRGVVGRGWMQCLLVVLMRPFYRPEVGRGGGLTG
jgi:hypothetical protein